MAETLHDGADEALPPSASAALFSPRSFLDQLIAQEANRAEPPTFAKSMSTLPSQGIDSTVAASIRTRSASPRRQPSIVEATATSSSTTMRPARQRSVLLSDDVDSFGSFADLPSEYVRKRSPGRLDVKDEDRIHSPELLASHCQVDNASFQPSSAATDVREAAGRKSPSPVAMASPHASSDHMLAGKPPSASADQRGRPAMTRGRSGHTRGPPVSRRAFIGRVPSPSNSRMRYPGWVRVPLDRGAHRPPVNSQPIDQVRPDVDEAVHLWSASSATDSRNALHESAHASGPIMLNSSLNSMEDPPSAATRTAIDSRSRDVQAPNGAPDSRGPSIDGTDSNKAIRPAQIPGLGRSRLQSNHRPFRRGLPPARRRVAPLPRQLIPSVPPDRSVPQPVRFSSHEAQAPPPSSPASGMESDIVRLSSKPQQKSGLEAFRGAQSPGQHSDPQAPPPRAQNDLPRSNVEGAGRTPSPAHIPLQSTGRPIPAPATSIEALHQPLNNTPFRVLPHTSNRLLAKARSLREQFEARTRLKTLSPRRSKSPSQAGAQVEVYDDMLGAAFVENSRLIRRVLDDYKDGTIDLDHNIERLIEYISRIERPNPPNVACSECGRLNRELSSRNEQIASLKAENEHFAKRITRLEKLASDRAEEQNELITQLRVSLEESAVERDRLRRLAAEEHDLLQSSLRDSVAELARENENLRQRLQSQVPS